MAISITDPLRILLTSAVLCCGILVSAVTEASTENTVDFSMPDLDGKVHTLSQYRGKWVVVNFWSTSCAPCLKEIPELSAFHSRHKDQDAVVLGVNFEDIKESWLRKFISSINMNYPVLLWGTDPATPLGPIVMLPTTFIVSPTGQYMGLQRGAITAEMLEKYIEQQRSITQGKLPVTESGPNGH